MAMRPGDPSAFIAEGRQLWNRVRIVSRVVPPHLAHRGGPSRTRASTNLSLNARRKAATGSTASPARTLSRGHDGWNSQRSARDDQRCRTARAQGIAGSAPSKTAPGSEPSPNAETAHAKASSAPGTARADASRSTKSARGAAIKTKVKQPISAKYGREVAGPRENPHMNKRSHSSMNPNRAYTANRTMIMALSA